MSDPGEPTAPLDPVPGEPPQPGGWTPQQRGLVIGLAAVLVAVLALVLFLVLRDDGDETTATSSSTTSSSSTTTSSSTTSSSTSSTTSTTTAPATQPESAVWPTAGTKIDDPVEAARRFATEFAGFTSPVVGEFQQGDSQSGEVQVRPTANGPVTTVFVRKIDGSWWVLGAANEHLLIDTPDAMEKVSSPMHLSGQSTAFEATILWELRADGQSKPLAEGHTNGGSNGEMGPYSVDVDFTSPGKGGGAVLLRTESAENGQVWEVSVLRVLFG